MTSYENKMIYQDGEVLFHAGDVGGDLMLIESGSVTISLKDERGFEYPISTIGAGELVGTLTFFNKSIRTAKATAKGETIVIRLSSHKFDQLVRKTPKWVKLVINDLVSRYKSSDKRFIEAQEKIRIISGAKFDYFLALVQLANTISTLYEIYSEKDSASNQSGVANEGSAVNDFELSLTSLYEKIKNMLSLSSTQLQELLLTLQQLKLIPRQGIVNHANICVLKKACHIARDFQLMGNEIKEIAIFDSLQVVDFKIMLKLPELSVMPGIQTTEVKFPLVAIEKKLENERYIQRFNSGLLIQMEQLELVKIDRSSKGISISFIPFDLETKVLGYKIFKRLNSVWLAAGRSRLKKSA